MSIFNLRRDNMGINKESLDKLNQMPKEDKADALKDFETIDQRESLLRQPISYPSHISLKGRVESISLDQDDHYGLSFNLYDEQGDVTDATLTISFKNYPTLKVGQSISVSISTN